MDHLLRAKKKYKNFKKQEIRDTFIKKNFPHDIAFGDFKISLGEQFLIRYYVVKHLILLKIQNKMVMKKVLPQWLTSFFEKSLSGIGVRSDIMSNQPLAEELLKPIIKNIEKQKV